MDGENTKRSFPGWLLRWVIGRKPRWTLARLAVLIVGTLVVFNYVLTPPIRVTGISMEPTLHDGQIDFLNRLVYAHGDPKRGDIVGVGYSQTAGNHHMLLKRIVGLPGEKIAFVRGRLMINDEPVDEPYVKSGCDWNMPPKELGPLQYYVVGDNRGMAFADHMQGIAYRKQIVGKILLRGSS
jgi:signal peptidase I